MIRTCLAALCLCAALSHPALAGPGAHGPNGEHLDAPAAGVPAGAARPGIEASTEGFELVGTLHADEFSVLVDRYDTNEPVTTGTLEVELGPIKAQARLHADIGDFSFADPKLLAALRQPGEHVLVFTLVTGHDTDLIEGALRTPPDTDARGQWHAGKLAAAVLAGLAVLAAAVTAWRLRRRRTPR
ncbi:hypothetical protein [Cupriavidus pauculus]|uniref:Copper resistance protein CopC n=1 Tax=Cupriavidus pauculus TaxID=82633 RepID=A0A3G8HAK3_9BURK|nr:hypothetical protein [Cupriavidus pauculus]AZG17160.1 hypothetical protein EHF44_27195 [Cupriavidus pauculus]